MKLEKIVTLCNRPNRLLFNAMERSLRDVGCDLPLLLIPFDQNIFDLPSNSQWWELPEITSWLGAHKSSNRLKKYQVLVEKDYLFVDPDIIFLRNPVEVMQELNGFIATDTEWNKPEYTYSQQSKAILEKMSSTWQKGIFNSGQFACSEAVYSLEELRKVAEDERYIATCLNYYKHDQPAINLLVHLSGIEMTNITLPPHNMESTWAGDYPGEYEGLWRNRETKPLLIHWAGSLLYNDLPINQLFINYLTAQEKQEWEAERQSKIEQNNKAASWPMGVRVLNRAVKSVYPKFQVQPLRKQMP